MEGRTRGTHCGREIKEGITVKRPGLGSKGNNCQEAWAGFKRVFGMARMGVSKATWLLALVARQPTNNMLLFEQSLASDGLPEGSLPLPRRSIDD